MCLRATRLRGSPVAWEIDQMSGEPEIAEIRQCLAKHLDDLMRLGVATLRLFGSYARGEARPDSDIDLLVAFEGPASFDAYMDLKFLLEEVLGRPVDLVTESALRPHLKPCVERESVRVA